MIEKLIVAFLSIYIIFLILLYSLQEKLIFVGIKPNHLLYQQYSFYSEDIISENTRLQGWKIDGASPESDRVLIYFGGNAEDVISKLPALTQLNVGKVYTFNYRGYALSEGRASEKNIYLDALNIYEFVREKSTNSKLIIAGHSLGSAVAGYLASEKKIEQLILLSPLSNISDIAQIQFKNSFPAFLLKHSFNLKEHVKKINAETLVVISQFDLIIPKSHSLQTFNNIQAEKRLIEIANAGHNNLFDLAETMRELDRFIMTEKKGLCTNNYI